MFKAFSCALGLLGVSLMEKQLMGIKFMDPNRSKKGNDLIPLSTCPEIAIISTFKDATQPFSEKSLLWT